jgi:uncharacterized membrane protein YjfL (UPF0719 family)
MKRLILLFLTLEAFLVLVFLFGDQMAQAATNLDNPLNFISVNDPAGLITKVIAGFALLIGTIAIAFSVFSGFKIVIATSEEGLETAKRSLTWSVGGFVVALLTYTIVSGVAKFLGFQQPSTAPTNTLQNPVNIGGAGNSASFIDVLVFVMTSFLGILGFATILMIVYYGYRYVTSAGNEEAVEKAKSGLRWSVIGFAASILAYTIIGSVQKFLIS